MGKTVFFLTKSGKMRNGKRLLLFTLFRISAAKGGGGGAALGRLPLRVVREALFSCLGGGCARVGAAGCPFPLRVLTLAVIRLLRVRGANKTFGPVSDQIGAVIKAYRAAGECIDEATLYGLIFAVNYHAVGNAGIKLLNVSRTEPNGNTVGGIQKLLHHLGKSLSG